jgi:Zn-dependent protease with chaperone function
MSWCGDKKIDAAQISATSATLKEVFGDLQKDKVLPPYARLEIVPGYPGVAGIKKSDAHVLADPEVFSCLSKQETKAVMLHEAGHYHDRSLSDMGVSLGLLGQSVLLLAALPVCVGAAYTLYRRVKWGKASTSWKGWTTALAVVFAAHTVVGRGIAEIQQRGEYRADAYAARMMRDPQPMISAFKNLYTFRPGYIGSPSAAYEKAKIENRDSEIDRVTLFLGVWGRHHTHPDMGKRIKKLEAMKQP